MQSPTVTSGRSQKASAGWFRGCNSSRNPWILDDAMYPWGVNVVNRGGIVQTRPGYRLALTLPPGNLQGLQIFQANKDTATSGYYMVFAVNGNVYSQQFPLSQPVDWELRRLKNITFSPTAKNVIFCLAQQSVTSGVSGALSIVGSHNILMMQDGGVSNAAYYDGTNNAQVSEEGPLFQTPKGSWMAFSGGRLWVARDNVLLAGDLYDPLSFNERITGTGRGDFRLPDVITGMSDTIGPDRQANLIVFTEKSSFSFLSYVADRTTWATTLGFQTTLYPNLGCVSGLSPVNYSGLLWWYSHGGLVSSDSATTAFISSRVKFRDVEMARSKRVFSSDLSGICTCAFESYLMVSVPSNDTLNSETMVMDYAIADELLGQEQPAWQGVWTGTRPVQWVAADVDGDRRCFHASVDYQALGGSPNHIWEAFQDNRMDTITFTDANNIVQTVDNPIYCSFETKLHGDGLDLKKFIYAQANLIEIGDVVNFKISYRGTQGGFKRILQTRILAPIDNESFNNEQIAKLIENDVTMVTQGRRIYSENSSSPNSGQSIESDYDDRIDRYFQLLFQWCGRAGVESYALYMDPIPERIRGKPQDDEEELTVITEDGTEIDVGPYDPPAS